MVMTKFYYICTIFYAYEDEEILFDDVCFLSGPVGLPTTGKKQ